MLRGSCQCRRRELEPLAASLPGCSASGAAVAARDRRRGDRM